MSGRGECYVSNLLIGIIGVALFIGLAMGAALFIGPQFDDAQNNALSSDTVQAVSSVASAVNSYRLATGYSVGPALSSAQALVSAGYLRDVPQNTALAGRPPQIVNAAGADSANSGASGTFAPKYVIMSIGGLQDLCTLIEKKVGSISTGQTVSATARTMEGAVNRQVGCFRISTGATAVSAGDYVVYSRI